MDDDDVRARTAKVLAALGSRPSELAQNSERLRAFFATAPSFSGAVEIPNEWLAQILGVEARLKEFGDLLAGVAERWNNPEGQGWIRLCELLRSAAADPLVKASAPAAEFLELMSLLAEDALGSRTLDETLAPLSSALASSRARAKHAKTERVTEWVLSEWSQHATAYERNKTAFARDYASRCKRERDTDVRERTIAFVWLKGK